MQARVVPREVHDIRQDLGPPFGERCTAGEPKLFELL
jgi:hypothetical protein